MATDRLAPPLRPQPPGLPRRATADAFRRLETRPLQKHRFRLSARGMGNLALLLLELAAVGVLGWWLVRTGSEWRSIAAAPEQVASPTALRTTPALVEAQVLPGGHSASSEGTIPEHLRALIKPLPPVVLPTPSPGRPSRIVIPAIQVDAPIVTGDGPEELKMGVGHHHGSANPGEAGNMVLSGHNDIYGQVFRHLDRLAPGDEVIVYCGAEAFTYRVSEKRIVQPTEVSLLAPSSEPIVTLISCYPYLVNTHRIAVIAELDHR